MARPKFSPLKLRRHQVPLSLTDAEEFVLKAITWDRTTEEMRRLCSGEVAMQAVRALWPEEYEKHETRFMEQVRKLRPEPLTEEELEAEKQRIDEEEEAERIRLGLPNMKEFERVQRSLGTLDKFDDPVKTRSK